jgi:hypothetical protein
VRTFTKEAAESLIAFVFPLIVTEIVLAAVLDATRYQSSTDFVPMRVEVALVNEPPFQVTDATEPVPATSWKMLAESTMSELGAVVVCCHDLVVVPTYDVEMLVVVVACCGDSVVSPWDGLNAAEIIAQF